MAVSSIQSGYQLIERASALTEEAADEINSTPSADITNPPNPIEKKDTYEFNQVALKPPEPTDPAAPAIKLTKASQYSRIGTDIVQRQQDMIGTMLDIRV